MSSKLFTTNFDVYDFLTNSTNEAAEIIKTACEIDVDLKTAEIPDYEEIQSHPTEDFALVLYSGKAGVLKKLANFSEPLTRLNVSAFAKVANSLPEEVRNVAAWNLRKSAEFFGVAWPKELAAYGLTKSASNIVDVSSVKEFVIPANETAYALPEQEKFPISRPEDIKEAAYYFERYWDIFPTNQRLEFAVNVTNAIKTAEIEITDDLPMFEKYSHLTSELNPNFVSLMEIRSSYAHAEHKNAYDELILKCAELTPEQLVYIVDELDKESGLNKNYDRLPDPILSVFAMQKTADCVEFAGRLIPYGEFVKQVGLKTYELRQSYDKGLVDSLLSPAGPEVFQELPLGLQKAVIRTVGL